LNSKIDSIKFKLLNGLALLPVTEIPALMLLVKEKKPWLLMFIPVKPQKVL